MPINITDFIAVTDYANVIQKCVLFNGFNFDIYTTKHG